MTAVRTLYVVTHPEAQHHTDGLVGGWFDSSLTPAGRAQADRIAARVRDLVPVGADVELYSSDLARAVQTAEPLAAVLQVEPVLVPGLREKSYGDAEGMPQSWLDARFVPPPPVGDRMGHHEGVAGSETRRELGSRVYQAVDAVLSSGCSHQVVVTHGFAVTFIVAAWIGMPLESTGLVNVRVSSGSITLLEEDDYFHNRTLVRVNDTAHLGGAP